MDLEKSMELVLTELRGLRIDMDDVKSDISVLKTDVAVLKTDVAGIKSELKSGKFTVGPLGTRTSGYTRAATGAYCIDSCLNGRSSDFGGENCRFPERM